MASTFGGGDTKLATAPGGSAERYPGATGRALHSGASPAFGDPDSQQLLKARVAQLVRGPPAEAKLDADGREWTVGREFALLDPNPVNCGGAEGQRRGSNSLVFSIAHNGRKYVLKMLINLINLTQEAHTVSGRSLDAHLLHRFGAEFHAPLLLRPPHPNVVHVRHHYQGDTTPFRGYLPLLVPEGLDVAVEMAGRTTFLVLDHYPETLPSLLSAWQGRGAAATPSHGDGSRASGAGGGQEGLARLPEQFVLQLTYQLLSAVEYLRSQGVVHRDIKGDNVFLDRRLRPVLGDFGFARTLRGFSGEAMPLTCSDQVYAGNPGAWAPELCRLSRADLQTLPRTATLEDVYSKSDAYAVSRMLYHLLDTPGSPALPTSTSQRPHYPDSAVPLLGRPVGGSLAHVLRNLVLDDPARRLTARQALLSVGVILCRSSGADLSTPQSAQDFCSSRLMALAALANQTSNDSSEHSTLSVTDSVTVNQNYCLADCLLRFTGSDLWGAYQETASLTH